MNYKLLGVLLFSSAAFKLNAQAIITAADYPVGGSVPYAFEGGAAPSPGESGANKFWDFSGIVVTDTSNYITYDCGVNNLCDTFPGSTYYNANLRANTTSYYIKNASGIYLNGFYQETGIHITNKFARPQKMIGFPIQYNAGYQDSFANSFYYQGNLYSSQRGYVSAIADGYGTIKTPIGTYTNVLRSRTEALTISGNDSSLVITYQWFQAGIGKPIMEITQLNNSASCRFTTTPPQNITSIPDIANAVNNIKIYPNPARGAFKINVGQLTHYTITIRNIIGAVLFQSEPDLSNTEMLINTAGWAKGIYIIQIESRQGAFVSTKIAVT